MFDATVAILIATAAAPLAFAQTDAPASEAVGKNKISPQAPSAPRSERDRLWYEAPKLRRLGNQGQQIDDERNRLWQEGNKLRREGKPKEAVAVAERMLAIEKRWLSEAHEEIGVSLEWLASIYEEAEDFDAADEKHAELIAWNARYLDKEHWKAASALVAAERCKQLRLLTDAQRESLHQARATIREGAKFYDDNKYAEAERFYREAIPIEKELLGESHPRYAEDLNRLGTILTKLDRHEDAIPHFQAAVDSYDKSKRPIDRAWMHSWVGDCWRDLKQDEKAVEAYGQSLKLFQRYNVTSGVSDDASDMGMALYRLKRYEEAIPLFRVAGTAYESQKRPIDSTWMLGWIGDAYVELKNDEQAAVAYAECLGRFSRIPHEEKLANNILQYAKVLFRLKRYDEAIQQFQVASKAFEKVDKPVDAAWMFGWIGDANRDTNKDDLAAAAYAECLARFSKIENHEADLSNNQLQYAKALYRLKRYEEAIPQFEAAVIAFEKVDKRADAAWMYGWIGDINVELKRDEAAVGAYAESVTRFSKIEHEEDLSNNLLQYAKALYRLERYEEAIPQFQAAAVAFEKANVPIDAAWMYGWIGDASWGLQQDESAVAAYAECLSRFSKIENHGADLSNNQLQYAKALYRLKRYEEAIPQFEATAKLYEKVDNQVDIGWMYSWIGDCYHGLNQDEKAVESFQKSIKIFAERDVPAGIADDASDLGMALYRLKRYEEAIPQFQAAVKAYEQTQNPTNAAWMFGWIGDCNRDMQKDEQAAAAYAECLARFSRIVHEADLSNNLLQYGKALYRLKRYEEAIPQFQAASEAFEKVKNQTNAAWMYGWVGVCNCELRRDELAVAAYNECFSRFAKFEHNENLAHDLSRFAQALYRLDRFEEAIPQFQAAADEYARADKPIDSAWMHGWVGDCNVALERDEPAAAAYAECIARFSKIEHEEDLSGNQYAFAKALYRMERYDEAIPNLQAVAQVYDKNEKASDAAGAYALIGECQVLTRQNDSAIESYKTAIDRYRVAGRENPPVSVLNDLANLYYSMAEFAEAEPLYRQALEMNAQLGEMHSDYAASLNNLGALYERMSDLERAEEYFHRALEVDKNVHGEDGPGYASALSNLAAIYRKMGRYDQAEPLYKQAQDIDFKVFGEEHPAYAADVSNLAGLYWSMGDRDRAEPLHRKALLIRKKVLPENHPDYATSLHNLALLYHYSPDKQKRAAPLYEKALAIRRKVLGENHPDTATTLNNLALLYQSQKDYERALKLCEQALAIIDQHVEATSVALAERQQLVYGENARWYLDNYLSCLAHLEDRDADAFRAVLAWKGTIIARQRAARVAAESPELAPLFSELQTITRQWAAAARTEDSAEWRDRLAELTTKKEQLEADLIRKSSAYREATKKASLEDLAASLPADAALVDFLEFWDAEASDSNPGQLDWQRSLLAFVVRPGPKVEMYDLGDVAPLTEAIDVWRGHGAQATFGLSKDAQEAGQMLRESLWQPIAAAIGDAKLVLISPDGALGRLPFAALPGKEPNSYLIEDYRLALVPVPQLLPAIVTQSNVKQLPKELLVVGGVDYDHQSHDAQSLPPQALAAAGPWRPWQRDVPRSAAPDGKWNFLSGSDSEIVFIKDKYQQATRAPADRIAELRGARATKERFCSLAPQCSLLHIATHGFFAVPEPTSLPPGTEQRGDRGNPFGQRLEALRSFSPGLLSGLVLAGANNPPDISDDPAQLEKIPDDGYLTADEIAFLPLNGAQLVVLSACETGLGEVAGGEGLLGIQRAFQVAGARTTIATLWKVNDEATRRIMEEFYRNFLERGLSPSASLHEAQLWALKNPDLIPRGADEPESEIDTSRLPPRFWAAFTLSGDWR